MPNSWFAFKQFTVQQDNCAMKVTSDACLFAAWAIRILQHEGATPQQVLDAGTGTGVLSLMLAQTFPQARILGIDIDADAAQQAAENFKQSPWNANLESRLADVFSFEAAATFDLVICNPPFFENQLQRKSERENLAAHSPANWLHQFFKRTHALCGRDARLALLLPAYRADECSMLARDAGWNLHHAVLLSARPGSNPYRCFFIFNKTGSAKPITPMQFCMYEDKELSKEARVVLSDYYLDR